MAKNVRNYQEPTHAEITTRAQRIYEMAGRPEGKAMEHWLQAETELIAENKAHVSQPQQAKLDAKSNTEPQAKPAHSRGNNWQASRPPVTHN